MKRESRKKRVENENVCKWIIKENLWSCKHLYVLIGVVSIYPYRLLLYVAICFVLSMLINYNTN